MVMPASTDVIAGKDLVLSADATFDDGDGPVVSREAVVDRCDKMCASDAIVYVVSGTGLLLADQGFQDENELRRHELAAGDFAFIPAWTEHQIRNQRTDNNLCLVVIQSGSRPVGAVLTDWGGDEVVVDKTRPVSDLG